MRGNDLLHELSYKYLFYLLRSHVTVFESEAIKSINYNDYQIKLKKYIEKSKLIFFNKRFG